jgi:hypothetical protein
MADGSWLVIDGESISEFRVWSSAKIVLGVELPKKFIPLVP